MLRISILVLWLEVLLPFASAQKVVGAAQGFAAGVTGGGNAKPDFPKTPAELKKLLEDKTARVIVLNKEFDFTGTEGKTTGTACASWGNGKACQRIIQKDCGNKPKLTVTWDNAARKAITVESNKTILGVGNKSSIKGKGLRMGKTTKNVIVQNIEVKDLNHQYVWGGDAISFDGADLIWIDHVKTTRPGRQHYVFGHGTSKRITLSNNFIDGKSTYSTGCDGYHYWTIEMVGKGDQITMQNNYIYHTAGRGPALSGGTLLHAVNNVWKDIKGHALEGGEATARGIFEGNVFKTIVDKYKGKLFGSASDQGGDKCKSALKRKCERNLVEGSTKGKFEFSDTSFFSAFSGLKIASAMPASKAKSFVIANAGKIKQ